MRVYHPGCVCVSALGFPLICGGKGWSLCVSPIGADEMFSFQIFTLYTARNVSTITLSEKLRFSQHKREISARPSHVKSQDFEEDGRLKH